jgi:hypothetical protein
MILRMDRVSGCGVVLAAQVQLGLANSGGAQELPSVIQASKNGTVWKARSCGIGPWDPTSTRGPFTEMGVAVLA